MHAYLNEHNLDYKRTNNAISRQQNMGQLRNREYWAEFGSYKGG